MKNLFIKDNDKKIEDGQKKLRKIIKPAKRRKLRSLKDLDCLDPKKIKYMKEAWESCNENFLNNQAINNRLKLFSKPSHQFFIRKFDLIIKQIKYKILINIKSQP